MRHHLSDPRVQAIIDRLVVQFLRAGSVNALAEALTNERAETGIRVHPNRLHSLLSEEISRSVNTGTLEAIEAGLSRAEAEDSPVADDAIPQRVAAGFDQAPVDADRIKWAAAHTGLPVAVVRRLAPEATPDISTAPPRSTPVDEADWTWQEDAIGAAMRTLEKGPCYRAGLVIPTGGGKTTIALQVGLRWLHNLERNDTVVLWVTHRRRLHTQARRTLHRLLRQPGVPDDATVLFAHRIQFVMTSDLERTIRGLGDRLALLIVDEAHHAAAPSYEAIFTVANAPALFLTATPNRTDRLPLGIDEIAYTVSYRELLERGCLVTPIFDSPLDMYGLDWTTSEGLHDLADYLLDRAEGDFRKLLVTVSTRGRAEKLYRSVVELLDNRDDHPFQADDIGYVHADRSSSGIAPADYLDEFVGRPAGILISTGQLIGEGFDDPSIDSVVVTYPSSSISHLMQVAGRALRRIPGKSIAHVVQVRDNALQYHFDQRWLYQDISDRLRPELIDITYGSPAQLAERISALLDKHHVERPVRARILKQLGELDASTDLSLMLTGIPYFSEPDRFASDAEWGAILVTADERHRFVEVVNDVSTRTDDIKDHKLYLLRYISPDSRTGSLWKSYVDLITAMEYARREINGTEYADQNSRPYRRNLSTTWIKYVTLKFAPAVPVALQHFLVDVINADEVRANYVAKPHAWAAAVKIELPLTGFITYLLDGAQSDWLLQERRQLVEQLRDTKPTQGWAVLGAWRADLLAAPIPVAIIGEIAQLTRPERFAVQCLSLITATGADENTA
jgi:superfamily II DNA or RNA helicase